MKNWLKKYTALILALVLVCAVCLMFAARKDGMFIDEIYTYGLANSRYAPYVTDIKDGDLIDKVMTREELTDYLTVGEDDRFAAGSVYYNQTRDVHPPLYYWLFNFVSSLVPGQFSMWTGLIPDRMQKIIDRRFEPLPAEERSSAPYDMIRAVVNLTAASILIAIGTSYKLPLSTTYVVFMVAMGSSLADRTWGRESAVYRITGVMAVISGWFITALGGFLIALCVTLLLLWGGWIAVTALVALCAWLLIRSHRTKPEEKAAAEELPVIKAETPDEVLCVCIGEVCTTMEQVTRIYNRTLVAVFKENRKVLKEMVQSSNRLFEEARDRKYGIMPTLRRLQQCDIDTGHFYVQVVDYLSEVTKALIHITRPAFGHIDNNHEGLSKEQIVDLMRVNDQVEAIFDKINDMLRTKDFSDLDMVLEMRDKLFDTIVEAIKNQLRRINGDPAASTRASVLYLTILNETKTMILQARNLLKSQHYFLESRK